jgi:endonuclease/exonuclease/phosphatase family metal-dependent hydrolase
MVRILRKLNLWVIFFTLLSYTAPFVKPSFMSLLMFAGLAYPWLLLANLIFIGIWAISRVRYWWWSTVVVLMGFNYLTSVFGINYFKSTPSVNPHQSLKVMTYNVGYCELLHYKNKLQAAQQMSDFIKNQNPDVLCFQEFYSGVVREEPNFSQKLPILAEYPYRLVAEGNIGILYSRFPIIGSESFDPKKVINGCAYADIQLPNQIIRVYNFHLASNRVSGIAAQLADKADIIDDDSWFSFGRMLALVRRKGILRQYEAELIKNHIRTSPYPVIVCGDFNDIPVSYTYSVLSDGLTDAFAQTGKGFGTTYNGKIPALRIDYILTSPNLQPVDCQIIRNRFSDHYSVVSRIQLGQ